MSHETFAPPIRLEIETLPVGLRKVFAQAELVWHARRTSDPRVLSQLYLYAKDYDALSSHLYTKYSDRNRGARPIERATWHGLPVKRVGA